MEAIAINLYNSLKKYYNHLFNTGYAVPSDTEKLLVYTFIEEIFEYSLVPYIEEEDYLTIGNALNCLYGSTCVLPHPEIKCSNYFLPEEIGTPVVEFRRSEDGTLRDSEDGVPRITEEDTF